MSGRRLRVDGLFDRTDHAILQGLWLDAQHLSSAVDAVAASEGEDQILARHMQRAGRRIQGRQEDGRGLGLGGATLRRSDLCGARIGRRRYRRAEAIRTAERGEGRDETHADDGGGDDEQETGTAHG